MTGDWRKSTRSSSGNCVEVAIGAEQVRMRDSKDPAGPMLSFDRPVFASFLEAIRATDGFRRKR